MFKMQQIKAKVVFVPATEKCKFFKLLKFVLQKNGSLSEKCLKTITEFSLKFITNCIVNLANVLVRLITIF